MHKDNFIKNYLIYYTPESDYNKETEEIKKIASIFEKKRNQYYKKKHYNGKIRKVLPQTNIKTGRNYKYFKTLNILSKSIPDLKLEEYIEAQFVLAKREIFPKDLISEWAIKRYFHYLKKIKTNPNFFKPKSHIPDVSKILKKDEEFLKLYIQNNKLPNDKQFHEILMPYKTIKISLPLFLYVDKKISMYYLALSPNLMKELKNIVITCEDEIFTKQFYKELCVLRDRFLDNAE